MDLMDLKSLVGQRVIVRSPTIYFVGTLHRYPRIGGYAVWVRNGHTEARVTFGEGDVKDINSYEIRIK